MVMKWFTHRVGNVFLLVCIYSIFKATEISTITIIIIRRRILNTEINMN